MHAPNYSIYFCCLILVEIGLFQALHLIFWNAYHTIVSYAQYIHHIKIPLSNIRLQICLPLEFFFIVRTKSGPLHVTCSDRGIAFCFADSLNLQLQTTTPNSRYITMETGDVILAGVVTSASESYRIEMDADTPAVRIIGRAKAGVFYGVQTLISLAMDSRGIPGGHISDQPRFTYRGLMMDVARNFRPKDEIIQLIDAMSMYKLNKLHLHLADDEGWRLEIDGLPELTEVGQIL